MAKDSLDDDLGAAVDKATGMADMKRSAAEVKKSNDGCVPCDSEGPRYPWGLEIRLKAESLKKLGIKDLPRVGEKMRVDAVAVVERVSEEETMRDGKKTEPRRNVTLQIQKMAVNPAKKS